MSEPNELSTAERLLLRGMLDDRGVFPVLQELVRWWDGQELVLSPDQPVPQRKPRSDKGQPRLTRYRRRQAQQPDDNKE